MKTSFKRFFLFAALLALVWIGNWWLGHLSARQNEGLDESLLSTRSLVTDPTAETKRSWPTVKSNLKPARQPVSIAITPPPEDMDEAREWARQNQPGALAWLMNASASEQRDAVAEMVCANVAQYDPAQAVSLAERFSGGNSNLLENLVHQWADQNEPTAYAYAISQPAGDERNRLLSRIAFVRARENPFEAAKLVAEYIAPGEVQKEAAISVLHQWALHDPNAALAWAQLFSDPELRARARTEVEKLLLEPPTEIRSTQPSL